MASPDTIILLTVDYHAAIWGQIPRAPVRTPLIGYRLQHIVFLILTVLWFTFLPPPKLAVGVLFSFCLLVCPQNEVVYEFL